MLAMLGEDFFFDVVGLYELMGQRPLATVTLYLLHKFELVGRLELDEDRLEAFLLTIEDGYPMESNPFTNKLHAADVVARFAAMVGSHRGALIFGSDAALLGGILAAAIHDFAHTGRSNSYHVALGDFVARQFNDQSVLENLSLQKALDLMATPRFDFAYKSRLSRDARRKVGRNPSPRVFPRARVWACVPAGRASVRVREAHGLLCPADPARHVSPRALGPNATNLEP